MRRFDTPYAAIVAHGSLAARNTEDERIALQAQLTPPFDDPAVVVAIAVAMARLGRGRGPTGLGWGPHRADVHSCHWQQGRLWNLTLLSPTVQELAKVGAANELGTLQAVGSQLEDGAARDSTAQASLPASLVGLLVAHARCGSVACLAVLAWVARCGLLPAGIDLASFGLSLDLRPARRPPSRTSDTALARHPAAPQGQPLRHTAAIPLTAAISAGDLL